jgi:two-component system, cell cycle response regulator DivK
LIIRYALFKRSHLAQNRKRIIKSFKKNLPIIATTAYALRDDWERWLEAGCDGYLPKPISINNLYTIMGKYLN